MSPRLISVLVLNILIYAVNILAYAARIAGIRTRRPAQANSLYNLLALSARAAFAIQATLLAGLVDRAEASAVIDLTATLRLLLLAAAAGIVAGATLLPTFTRILVRGTRSWERRGSMPRVILHGLSIEGLPQMWNLLRRPRASAIHYARQNRPGKGWIAITLLVAALNAVAGPAAQIASVTAAQGTRTSLTLPTFFTGLGLILIVFLVDPITAQVMDQALRGERPDGDVIVFTVWQIGGRLGGVLAAQLLLEPMSVFFAMITQWLIH